MTRPLVAVTATTEIIRDALRARLNASYVAAIEGAGLIPLVSPPLADPAAARALLARVDGLVLTGGEDIDPRHYGVDRHPATADPHAGRDVWELALAEAARERGLPVLAICRGMQLLNVALGGTLIQDIPAERPSALRHAHSAARRRRVHGIECEPGSRLEGALGARTLTVNSSHHQSIDRVAPSLRVSARAPDGIIEGVETSDGAWWVVGAQWHPEELIDTPEPWDRALFSAFAAEVQGHVTASDQFTSPAPGGKHR
jgi:putative glutamine amidotransferase